MKLDLICTKPDADYLVLSYPSLFFCVQHVCQSLLPSSSLSAVALSSRVYQSHISQSECVRTGASKADEQPQLRGRAEGRVTPKKGERGDEKVKVDVPL